MELINITQKDGKDIVSQNIINLDLIIQLATDAKVLMLEAKQETRPEYFTVAGFFVKTKLKVGRDLAKQIGMEASKLCKSKGYPIDKVADPRFGEVNSYPLPILQQAYDAVVK